MPDKFKNKYRNSSARWQKWDYSAEGAYFITICTAHRQCILGKIENNEMFLSDYGKIVREQWDKSFDIRKELFCDIYVIMPNHIHAIVQIKYPHGDARPQCRDARPCVPTNGHAIPYREPKSISSFVAGFKSIVTKRINELRNTPAQPVWQSRFHDHVIRNDADYYRIASYIATNVANWGDDSLHNEINP